jgi:hypothetical protein
MPDEQATLMIEAWGSQAIKVEYATAGGPGDSPYVVMTARHALVYCLDAEAVTSGLATWLHARYRTVRMLPVEARPPTHRATDRAVGSVTLTGGARLSDVRAFAEANSPNGRTHTIVRLGPLSVRAYDRLALDSHVHAWLDAFAASRDAFDVGPRHSIRDLDQYARSLVRGPYRPVEPRDGIGRDDRLNPTWRAARGSDLQLVDGSQRLRDVVRDDLRDVADGPSSQTASREVR